jgi:D-alanyl-D-alanine carboxypeptidase
MRFLPAILIGVLACAPAHADAVDDIVTAEMKKAQIPGVAIGVVHKGKVVKLAGYGLADVEQRIAVTPQTLFQIQSISKTFTASAIMLLAVDGKLKVDDPVSKHLDGTPESWKDITLRHLLSHTSGIKDFINEPLSSLRLEITEQKVFDEAIKRPLNFPVGTKYAYSNTNFHLLAMILRKHAGEGWGEVVRKRLFEPAGMSSSRLMSWDDIIPGRARGYRKTLFGLGIRNGDFVAQSVLAYGGGGILSNVEDMTRWELALRNESILKSHALKQMWTATKLNDGKPVGYGLGWGVGGTPDHPTVSHSGGHITGFSTLHIRYLKDDLAIIILTNMNGANTSRIASKVAANYVPGITIASQPALEDKEPQVTQRTRQIIGDLSAGKLNEDQFTPEMNGFLKANLKQVGALFPKAGAIKSMELLRRDTVDKDSTRHVYRLRTGDATLQLTAVYDKQQKLSGLWVFEE